MPAAAPVLRCQAVARLRARHQPIHVQPQPSIGESVAEYTSPTAAPVERSQWERIVLAPDVELHVRRPLSRTQNKQVDRLVTIARELLEED